jgi:hypothetical protein
MGCVFNAEIINVSTPKQLNKEYLAMKKSVMSAYNYQGYSGTMAEDSGLEIEITKVFTSLEEAEKHIYENTEKWGPSLAVLVKVKASKAKGIEGKKYWVIGGHYSC